MPIDASMYSNVQAPANNFSPIDSAEKAMRLSALGMQQAQMGYQMYQMGAMRSAYAQNTDPNSGQFDRAGYLSALGKTAPMAAQSEQAKFAQMDKEQAEAKVAQMQAAHQTLSVTTPALQYLLSLPDEQAVKAYPNVIGQLKDQGVTTKNAPPEWDRGWAQQGYSVGSKMKEGLENQMLAVNVGKVPAEINASLYGSRSPNAEITSQYDKQANPVRGSQMAMNQMMDNYHNPSPQGDASLILNAYKIKFPDKPDVNSLEELSTSQATPDKWKNIANRTLSGGLDQPTRDNLMRDGISTFRANVQTLRGVQQRYQTRAQQQNVNDPTLTYEPGIEKTFGDAMALQKQIGPYVPPSGRGGVTGALTNLASKITGTGGNQPANASAPLVKPGSVEDGYVFMGGDPGKQSSWKRAN